MQEMSVNISVSEVLNRVRDISENNIRHDRILSIHTMRCCRLFHNLIFKVKYACWPNVGNQSHSRPKTIQLESISLAQVFNTVLLSYLDDCPRGTQEDLHDKCVTIAQIMKAYIGAVDLEKEVFSLPPSHPRREDMFDCVVPIGDMEYSQEDRDLNEAAAQVFMYWMDLMDSHFARQVKLSAEEISHLKMVISLNPMILKISFTPGRFPTILDHCLCGAISNMEIAEWVIQMGGLQVRAQRDITGRPTFCLALGDKPYGGPPKPSSHLMVSVENQCSWAVHLILAATQARDIEYARALDGNTALHLCFLARNVELIEIVLLQHPSFLNILNKHDLTPAQIIVNDEVRECLKRLRVSTASQEEYRARENKVKNENAANQQKYGNSKSMQSKIAAKALRKEAQSTSRPPTAEEMKAAQKAEEELLKLLENEEPSKSNSGPKGRAPKGNGKQKGSK